MIGRLLGGAVLMALAGCSHPVGPCRSTATGTLRTHPLTSTTYGNTRTVRVLLPPGYDAPGDTAHYPVLLLMDGQNLFDACLSDSRQEWRVDETVDSLVRAGRIPPVIVVGVDNAGKDRSREYLPYPDLRQTPELTDTHPGQRFPSFLVDEVLPLVRGTYRMRSDRASTAIGGSSYGAIAALYAIDSRPDVFGLALLESAPFWVGDDQLLRDVRHTTQLPIRVWMGAGGKEATDQEEDVLFMRVTHGVVDSLRAQGLDTTRLRYKFVPNGTHSETSWAERLPMALEFLYRR